MWQTLCSSIAVVVDYAFSCAFMWMLLEGYQLYLMLVRVFDTKLSRSLLYHSLAYGRLFASLFSSKRETGRYHFLYKSCHLVTVGRLALAASSSASRSTTGGVL